MTLRAVCMSAATYRHEIFISVFVFFSRYFFKSAYLINWDAANFVLGLRAFDISKHQPHPPGYILYIAIGNIFHFFIQDANAALVLISIFASIIACIIFYRLILFFLKDPFVSFLATLAVATSPFIWFHGEVALTYIFDGLFSVVFFLLAVKSLHHDERYLFLFSFFLALSGGIRQSLTVLFLPLFLTTFVLLVVRKKVTPAFIVKNLVILASAFLFWFMPLVWLSKGLRSYYQMTVPQLQEVAFKTSIFKAVSTDALLAQWKHVITSTGAVIQSFFLIIPFGFINLRKKKPDAIFALLFMAWFVPSFFVYSFVHFGQASYLMTVAFGILLVLLIWLKGSPYIKPVLVSIVCLNAIIFCFVDSRSPRDYSAGNVPVGIYERVLFPNRLFTRDAIARNDLFVSRIIREAEKMDPTDTIVILDLNNEQGDNPDSSLIFELSRRLQVYLPEYLLMRLDYHGEYSTAQYFDLATRTHADRVEVSSDIQHLFIIGPALDDHVTGLEIERSIVLNDRQNISVLSFHDQRAEYDDFVFTKGDETGNEGEGAVFPEQ